MKTLFLFFCLFSTFCRAAFDPFVDYLPMDVRQMEDSVIMWKAEVARARIFRSCSGFFIGEKVLVSNLHCLRNAVRYVGSHNVQAFKEGVVPLGIRRVLARSEEHDLVILEVEGSRRGASVTLNYPKSGDRVYGVGYPHGILRSFGGRYYNLRYMGPHIFTAVPGVYDIGGMSGSPIFNEEGQVVGIIKSYDPRGSGIVAVIPIEHLISLMHDVGLPLSLASDISVARFNLWD